VIEVIKIRNYASSINWSNA